MSAEDRRNRMFEALDDMGALVYRDYVNGNKSDARNRFNSCPVERRAYLLYTILGCHMTSGDNPRIIDFDDFIKSVTP